MLNGISRDMVMGVIGGYRFSTDAEYMRYKGLDGFITLGMRREAFQEDDVRDIEERREKIKERGFKGEGGISAGVSRMFRDMMEEYLPGGYFRWEDHAKRILDNFYKMAYSQFKSLLPKLLVGKLRDFEIDRSEGGIEIDSEMVNKVIMDSLVYLHDHPEELRDGLIRAYRRKGREDDRGVGMMEAFFVPRVDRSALVERGEKEVKEGDTDVEVLDNLRDRGEVKWRWLGIDEYGVLRFTLPELYGSREFRVKLPREIQYIKPGEYTFVVKDIKDGRGAVIEFKEQHDQVKSNELKEIEEKGLGVDQLLSFINNGVINKYIGYLRSLPGEKLVEDFLGTFSIGGNQIGSVEELRDIGIEESNKEKVTKGKEKAREKYQESLDRERSKLQEMVTRWMNAPEIARHFMKVREDEGTQIARAVGEKFPKVSEKGVPSLDSVLATSPVVEMVLGYVMSPHVPVSSGKSAPWIHFAWDAFQKMALKDPLVRLSMEQMVRHSRKDREPGLPVSDGDIRALLGSFKNINVAFQRLKDKIAGVIRASEDTPELKKFFDRRKVFKAYSDRVLADDVYEYMEEHGLSMDKSDDMEKIQKFMKDRIKILVDVMEGRRPLKSLYSTSDKKKDKETVVSVAPVTEKMSYDIEALIRHKMMQMTLVA